MIYKCELCNFDTDNKTKYNLHCDSDKHKLNEKYEKFLREIIDINNYDGDYRKLDRDIYQCLSCKKIYKYLSNINNHVKNCENINEDSTNKDLCIPNENIINNEVYNDKIFNNNIGNQVATICQENIIPSTFASLAMLQNNNTSNILNLVNLKEDNTNKNNSCMLNEVKNQQNNYSENDKLNIFEKFRNELNELNEKNIIIKEKDNIIKEKDNIIKEKDNIIKEKDNEIKEITIKLQNKIEKLKLKLKEDDFKKREEAIKKKEEQLLNNESKNVVNNRQINNQVNSNNNTNYNIVFSNKIKYVQEKIKNPNYLQEIDNFNYVKEENKNIDQIREIVYDLKRNIFIKNIGEHILKLYKKEDPREQSLFATDSERYHYITCLLRKAEPTWIIDKKGEKVKEKIITPVCNSLLNKIKTFENSVRSGEVYISQNERYISEHIYNLKEDIINGIFSEQVKKIISPHFANMSELENF